MLISSPGIVGDHGTSLLLGLFLPISIVWCLRVISHHAVIFPRPGSRPSHPSSHTYMYSPRLREGGAGVHVAPVDAAAHMASALLEAVEAAEGEAPGPAADAPFDRDASMVRNDGES